MYVIMIAVGFIILFYYLLVVKVQGKNADQIEAEFTESDEITDENK